MKVPVKAMKIVCDVCGRTYENYNGWTCIVGDEDGSEMMSDAIDDDWMELGGKLYCPDCYDINENDDVITKDGRIFDFETEEEKCNETC